MFMATTSSGPATTTTTGTACLSENDTTIFMTRRTLLMATRTLDMFMASRTMRLNDGLDVCVRNGPMLTDLSIAPRDVFRIFRTPLISEPLHV